MLSASDGPAGALGLGAALWPGEPGEGVGVGVGVGDGEGLDVVFVPPDGAGAGAGRLKCSTQLKPPAAGHGMPLATSAMRKLRVSEALPLGPELGACVALDAGLCP